MTTTSDHEQPDTVALAIAVLDAWVEPATPGDALAYRPLAEALTGIALPLPIDPHEVDRRVAVARRNREYSAAHTDAMLPGDPPLLPGLLARAEALDAGERRAFVDGTTEWERRRQLAPGDVADGDLRLARAARAAVIGLAPVAAAVVVLRHGLAGDRPRRPDEVARMLGLAHDAVRRHEGEASAVLRATDAVAAIRDVLDTRTSPPRQAYP